MICFQLSQSRSTELRPKRYRSTLCQRTEPSRNGRKALRPNFVQTFGILIATLLTACNVESVALAAKGSLKSPVRLPSPILGRDILASVYEPAGYDAATGNTRRYPVVYLLHGHGDDHTAWSRLGHITTTLDRMIAAGALRPVIVVMPAAAKSWYVNDVRPDGYGAMFNAFQTDLPRAVDDRWQTAACSGGRAIGGLSMGGYGALLLGTARPFRYATIFSLFGAVFPSYLSNDPKRRAWMAKLYDGVHGVPIRKDRLLAWNTFERFKTLRSEDAGRLRVWFSTGDDDFFPSIVSGTVKGFQMLRQLGFEAELRVDDAGHSWSYWRRSVEPALQWASRYLLTACGT